MYKRGLTILLSILMLVAAFPVNASATTEEKKTEICNQISRDFQSALTSAGKEDFIGYCGLMAGWQLYVMGINQAVHAYNGNLQFDYYTKLDMTTGGHKVKTYSADAYTLREALNAVSNNGKRNVYNMLVGFQWTSTEAGATCGHVVVVYAIIDGMVYFTEGFQTSLGSYPGGPIIVSIDRFADYFDDWTRFDGLVVFGDKIYLNNCMEYPSDMFVKATQAADVYSQPCGLEDHEIESELLRTVAVGERLRVTKLYENTLNQFYYQIQNDGKIGYIAAESVEPVLELAQGSNYVLDGERITGVLVQMARHTRQINDGWVWDNDCWYYYDNGIARTGWFCYDGLDYYLQADGSITTGWKKINGQDRYFSDTGAMRTGWLNTEQGCYYLLRNGVKVTGWRTIDGSKYYFDKDGVLQADGWFTKDSETYYLFADGSVATGWTDLPEGRFCFSEDGHLLAEMVQDENGSLIRAVNATVHNGLDSCAARQSDNG